MRPVDPTESIGSHSPPMRDVAHRSDELTPAGRGAGPLVAAALVWGAIGTAVSLGNGTYSSLAVSFAVAGWLGLVSSTFWVPRFDRAPKWGLALVASIAVAVAYAFPGAIYGRGPWLGASHGLMLAATILVAFSVPASCSRARQAVLLAVITCLAGAADVAIIRASPHPRIDVWYMYQAASRGILHGSNPYGLHWTSSIPGEVSNGFSYLPGSAVILAPFNWLFGDVRYGLVVVTVVAAWTIFWIARGEYAWLLSSFVLVFPKTTFGIEQSWNDPILLALFALFMAMVISGRLIPATVFLALVLSSIQYGLLFLPFVLLWKLLPWRRTGLAVLGAACLALPWIVQDWTAAWHAIVIYPFRLPPRADSLSLFTLSLKHGLRPGAAFWAVPTAAVFFAVVVRVEKTAWGFCRAVTATFATFVIFNKQVFYNDWELVALLAVVAAAVGTSRAAQASSVASVVAGRGASTP
jgi:hypothetical protein